MESEIRSNMEVPVETAAPLQDSQHISGYRSGIPSQEQMPPMELQASNPSLMMEDNQDFLFNQESNFGSMDILESEDIWSSEKLWAASGGAIEGMHEAMGIDAKGIGSGAAGGSYMCQQESSSMLQLQIQKDIDEVWAEIDKGSTEAQIQAPHMPLAQQQIGADAVFSDGKQVTLENFLGKPDWVHGSFTSKEFGGAEFASGLVNPMQVRHHGAMMYPMVGHGMLFSDEYAKTPLVSLPYEAQAGMTTAIHSSPEMMNSMAQANLMHNIRKTVMVRSSKRKQEVPNEEIIKNKERRNHRMIKNRKSSSQSRARKQAYFIELEAKLSYLKEENKRLRGMEKWNNIMERNRTLAVEMAMEQVEEDNTSKKGGHAMHQHRNSCVW